MRCCASCGAVYRLLRIDKRIEPTAPMFYSYYACSQHNNRRYGYEKIENYIANNHRRFGVFSFHLRPMSKVKCQNFNVFFLIIDSYILA